MQRVEDRAQLQADQPEQQGVEHEGEDLPDGVALQPRLHGRQLGRVPAHVDAYRDHRQHGGDAGCLRRQEGEVARQQRDRDLGRRVVDASADLPQDVADRETDRHSPDDVHREAPGRVPEREASRHHGGDGEAVGDERGRVVDQALALDQRHEPARDAEARGDRRRRHRIGGCDDGADHEADGPGEAADQGVAHRSHREHRREHEAQGEQRDGPRIGAQVAQRGEEGGRVEQRRQEADEHDVRPQRVVRDARDEPDREAAEHEQDRVRDPQDRREHQQGRRGREQRPQDERVVGRDRHGQDPRSTSRVTDSG